MKSKKPKNNKFFSNLKESLEEVLAHTQGKLTLHSEDIEIPEPPMAYSEKEIQKIRKKGNYSQDIFAKILNVSVKTVQSWESGERTPSHAALRLLEIVDKGIYRPEIFKR